MIRAMDEMQRIALLLSRLVYVCVHGGCMCVCMGWVGGLAPLRLSSGVPMDMLL